MSFDSSSLTNCFPALLPFPFSILVAKFEIIERKEELNEQVISAFIFTSLSITPHRKKSSSLDKLSLFFHCAIYRSNLFLINPNFILISDLIIKKFYWKISEKFQVFNSSKAFLSFPFTTIFESDSSSLKVKSASLFLSNQN